MKPRAGGWNRSDRFNRPALVPVAVPEPAPPADVVRPLVRLGEVMHLNGAVPRDVDPRDADPHRCRRCSGLVIRRGLAYCDECRKARCSDCHGPDGEHRPSCRRRRTPRLCRGCASVLPTRYGLYCRACQAQQCPECRVLAGRHGARCLYERRRRRPGLTALHNVVSQEEIAALYLAHRARAVRVAARICGPAFAEDVVHDVVLYLLEKRALLKDAPGRGYFLTAVKHGATRRLLYAWERLTVRMDPDALIIAEQMTHPSRARRLPAPTLA